MNKRFIANKILFLTLFVLLNKVHASDSSYIKNLIKCLNPVYIDANSYKIIPVLAIKDSTEGICFLSFEDLSDLLDSSIAYSAYFIDSLFRNNIRFKLNNFNLTIIPYRFISLQELLFNSNLISKNCLVKGRRMSLFKHEYYIDYKLSDHNKFIWIWNEFLNGNYYEWYSCEGMYTKEDYFYYLYAK